jgi:hypothetical protein
MDVRVVVSQQPASLTCFGSEDIDTLDMLGQFEFDVLALLFNQRRSLPVYRDRLWYCYDCGFYSLNIEEVGQHLLQHHEPSPPDEEELTVH